MTTAIVVQARLGSTRLPGKNLLPLGGQPMLVVLLGRLLRCARANVVVVATTKLARDDALVEVARRLCPVFRGPEDDVLRRYFGAGVDVDERQDGLYARPKYDVIVRITADCPFADPDVVDAMIDEFQRRLGLQYLSNCHPERTVPRGFDVEVLTFAALTRAHREAELPEDREHVTRYVHTTASDRFAIGTWRPDPPVPVDGVPNLSVDTREDYERIVRIFEAVGPTAPMRVVIEEATR